MIIRLKVLKVFGLIWVLVLSQTVLFGSGLEAGGLKPGQMRLGLEIIAGLNEFRDRLTHDWARILKNDLNFASPEAGQNNRAADRRAELALEALTLLLRADPPENPSALENLGRTLAQIRQCEMDIARLIERGRNTAAQSLLAVLAMAETRHLIEMKTDSLVRGGPYNLYIPDNLALPKLEGKQIKNLDSTGAALSFNGTIPPAGSFSPVPGDQVVSTKPPSAPPVQ